MIKNYFNRPFLIIANSSWYLLHYRKLLLNELKTRKINVITISPVDNSTSDLSKETLHIPWRISRSGNKNIVKIFLSLIRLIFIFRTLKPKLVHSHTLKTNFLATIASFLLGIPCVLSFAGLGQISRSKGIKRLLIIFVLKIISFLSFRQLSRNLFSINFNRTKFIFQNKEDMLFIGRVFKNIPVNSKFLIYGSGVPKEYLNKKNKKYWQSKSSLQNSEISCNLIYSGRLLKSKGIINFIKITEKLKNYNSFVFGGLDPSSQDSLKAKELKVFKSLYKNINFYGVQKNPLMRKFNNFPILIVPSIYGEGIPRGILEAMILNIPVVSSKEASCKFFDDSMIYIAKNNSNSAYINCINRIILDFKNKKLKSRLQKCEKFVKNNLLESHIVNKTIFVYNSFEEIDNKRGNKLIDDWLTI